MTVPTTVRSVVLVELLVSQVDDIVDDDVSYHIIYRCIMEPLYRANKDDLLDCSGASNCLHK